MKTYCVLLFFFLSFSKIYSQSASESAVLTLSAAIFKWEVASKIDSLENIMHEKFIVVSSAGELQNKQAYVTRLRSGNFIHNSIDIEENTVAVADNTATVVGKGIFNVTVSGNKVILHLSCMEVFTRKNTEAPWLLLAMKASVLKE